MQYLVELMPRARRELERLPNHVARTAAERMMRLADDPRPRASKKLKGVPPRWRLRFGDYRVIYTISDSDRLVAVLRVVRRGKGIYDA